MTQREEFLVGIPGELTADRVAALKAARIEFMSMGNTSSLGAGETAPADEQERAWIKLSASDDDDVRTRIAEALGLDPEALLVMGTTGSS